MAEKRDTIDNRTIRDFFAALSKRSGIIKEVDSTQVELGSDQFHPQDIEDVGGVGIEVVTIFSAIKAGDVTAADIHSKFLKVAEEVDGLDLGGPEDNVPTILFSQIATDEKHSNFDIRIISAGPDERIIGSYRMAVRSDHMKAVCDHFGKGPS